MEANAGNRFPQLLSKMLSPSESLPKMQSFAWNLGVRETVPSFLPFFNVADIIPEADALHYTERFFEMVHPHYGFIDQEEFTEILHKRWANVREPNSYDAVVCGVIALGSVCCPNGGFAREADLVACSRTILGSNIVGTSTIDDVVAWVLRTIYLRTTSTPNSAWITSCTALHVIEVVGIHLDSTDDATVYGQNPHSNSIGHKIQDRSRRLFWIARMLNTWISLECGRSRVEMPSASVPIPRARRGDHTPENIATYKLSERLVPGSVCPPNELEDMLYRVEATRPAHDKLTLSKANLVMTIYRRLRVFGPCLSKGVLDAILYGGEQGMEAARRLANQGMPWWHIANVPFQFLCVLLAMDTRESMALVPSAMQALKYIATRFNTHTMREALKTAGLLVRLSQKKKEQDIVALGEGLRFQQPIGTAVAPAQPKLPSKAKNLVDTPVASDVSTESFDATLPWLDDINLNAMPDLANFDWDQFLGTGTGPGPANGAPLTLTHLNPYPNPSNAYRGSAPREVTFVDGVGPTATQRFSPSFM